MKRIDEKTVIDTLSACLKANATLPAASQKDGAYIASGVSEAFLALDAKLIPAPSGSRKKVRRANRR